MDSKADDWDHSIINAVSIALKGQIGLKNDIERLKEQIVKGRSTDKLHTACEIAVAFIRYAQDLKEQRDNYKNNQLQAVLDVAEQQNRLDDCILKWLHKERRTISEKTTRRVKSKNKKGMGSKDSIKLDVIGELIDGLFEAKIDAMSPENKARFRSIYEESLLES